MNTATRHAIVKLTPDYEVTVAAEDENGKYALAVIEYIHPERGRVRTCYNQNGNRFHAPAGAGEHLRKKLEAMNREDVENDVLRPRLTSLIDATPVEPARPAASDSAVVGDVVYVHSMNRWRRGLVIKTGRTRVTVAYTTASSEGRVYRKAVGAQHIRKGQQSA